MPYLRDIYRWAQFRLPTAIFSNQISIRLFVWRCYVIILILTYPFFFQACFFSGSWNSLVVCCCLIPLYRMSLSARQNKYSLKSCCALREKSDNFLPNFVLCMFCKLYPTSVCFLRMHEDCISQRILDSTLSSQFWYVYAYQCMLTR